MSNLMDETVKEICTSMLNDPDRWVISTHRVKDKISGINYWTSYTNKLTEIWDGVGTEKVFTDEQGILLMAAYQQMRENKATATQEKIIKAYKPKPSFILYEVTPNKKWYEFWK